MKIAFIDLGIKPTQFFAATSKHFPASFETVFFSTKPKVRSYLQRSGHALGPNRRIRHISVNASEEIIHEAGAKYRLLGYTETWIGQRVSSYLCDLQDFFEETAPDAIFVWNGSGLISSIAKHLARTAEIPVVHGENGYLPFTTQIDRSGVNYNASFTKQIRSDLRTPVPTIKRRQAAQRRLEQVRSGLIPAYQKRQDLVQPSIWSYLEEAIVNAKHPRRLSRFNQTIPTQPKLPERYILLPLQVINDSQLLFHSHIIGQDLDRLVRSSAEALRKVAPDHRLVVKLHPMDIGNTNYDHLARELTDVVFIKGMSIHEVLKPAAAVITVNSTVGFEGLLFGKPVLAAGKNFYTVPELTHNIDHLEQLEDGLEATLGTQIDDATVIRLCDLCCEEYFAAGSWRDHHPRSYKAVANKILRELGEHQTPSFTDSSARHARQTAAN